MRRKLFTVVAATLAGLSFTATAHADNVNLNTAGAKCTAYANTSPRSRWASSTTGSAIA